MDPRMCGVRSLFCLGTFLLVLCAVESSPASPGGCPTMTCDTDRCIQDSWRCDGQADCEDGTDEKDCDPSRECPPDTFSCRDGICIRETWRCDFQDDCQNGQDEKDCDYPKCTDQEFTCQDGYCVDTESVCDGFVDCANDDADEQNCPTTSPPNLCSGTQFTCSTPGVYRNPYSNRCIPGKWRCDGMADCHDKSDENACATITPACSADQFMCPTTKVCIPGSSRCDGEPDCPDGQSDEVGCE